MHKLRQKIIFYIGTHQGLRSFLYWVLAGCSRFAIFEGIIKWIFGGEQALSAPFSSLLDNPKYSDKEILHIFVIIQNVCSGQRAQPIWDILEEKRPEVAEEYEEKYV